jgi:AraC family transcriptional regulator of adaptative response / DNA-3-methyladenine glycosylase II
MSTTLDPDVCYRAVQTKDSRFDGQFFMAVSTTGIYCRPICPATTPKRENCTFFPSAAAAQHAGFRPCLRCRPELSPQLLAYVGTASTVAQALRLIGDGALDEGKVEDIATRLGVGDRHLRQLFATHLGTSPLAVAQTRRLLFAKQLIDETALSMTDIAMAAGFTSIRRFNDVIRKTYGRSPSDLRRQTVQPLATNLTPAISLKLPFSQPYNWEAFVRFLVPRATPGLESVCSDHYQRTIVLDGRHGVINVQPIAGQSYLLAHIYFPNVTGLAQIVERLRRMFDLNANINEIASHLETDPVLAPIVAQQAGLRIPGAWDTFELAVRAILGQQISVAAATRLAGRLVETYGAPLSIGLNEDAALSDRTWIDPALQYVFPLPDILAAADLTALGIPKQRAAAIANLAAAVAQTPTLLTHHSLEASVEALCQLPGIGEWTAQYIAMRALREPDAFPATDLGLRRAMDKLGHPMTNAELLERSQIWRPWQAYAAMHLWTLDTSLSNQERRSA